MFLDGLQVLKMDMSIFVWDKGFIFDTCKPSKKMQMSSFV